MALIVYPLDNYDTFCSLANAETLLLANVPSAQRALWDAPLPDPDKEILLRQATRLIKAQITLPDTLEDDLQLATALLANHSVGIDMNNEDGKENVKRKEIVGVVETEYFKKGESSNSMPDSVSSLIEQYQSSGSGSFTFNRS